MLLANMHWLEFLQGADNKWLKVLTISDFHDTSMLNAFDSRFVDQLRNNSKRY